MISPPVSVEPVNATLSTRDAGRGRPRRPPSPGTTLRARGEADLGASSARRSADSGVAESGFRTTVQPAASAGASFQVVIIISG